jgi:hypothetical protein
MIWLKFCIEYINNIASEETNGRVVEKFISRRDA